MKTRCDMIASIHQTYTPCNKLGFHRALSSRFKYLIEKVKCGTPENAKRYAIDEAKAIHHALWLMEEVNGVSVETDEQ